MCWAHWIATNLIQVSTTVGSFMMFEWSEIGRLTMLFLHVPCCPLLAPSSHFSPTAGGRKKYDRDHLLSLRFLKECMEPPEGLFLPGALSLVRKTGGDIPGPMSVGYPRDPRDVRDSRDDRYPGGRDKRVCVCACVRACMHVCACACAYAHTCTSACLLVCLHVCVHMHV